jgi:hypothetical protein
MEIGFIGLGNMGGPMVRNLAAAGFALTVRDANDALQAQIAAEVGAAGAASSSDFADVDVVVTMLPDDRAVSAVMLEWDGGIASALRPGAVLVDMSSSNPNGTIKLGKALAERGVGFVDSPVSGGIARAATGTLALMAGTDDPAYLERIDDTHANPPNCLAIRFCRNHNQRLVAAAPSRLAFFQTAEIGLVHFHPSRQFVAARSDHGPTQFVQPCPGRLVTPQPQHPLDPQRTRPVFLAGHIPHRPEPHDQRLAYILENRPRRHRGLAPTPSALEQGLTDYTRLHPATLGTPKAVGPPHPDQILPTCLFR